MASISQGAWATSEPTVRMNSVQLSTRQALIDDINQRRLHLEEVDCISGTTRQEAHQISDRDRYGFPISTYLCPRTGLMWTSPIFDDAGQAVFYRDHYRALYLGQERATDVFFAEQVEHGREILVRLGSKLSPHGSVFDIGCGAGGVLLPFKEKGYACYGCDFGESYLQFGRSKGLDLLEGDSSVLPAAQPASLIIASHVLEHIPKPDLAVQQWASLLAPGGFLYIEVPGSFVAMDNYRTIDRYFHLAHTYHFTLESLDYVAAKAGLKRVSGDQSIWALYEKAPTQLDQAELQRAASCLHRYMLRSQQAHRKIWQLVRRPALKLRKRLRLGR